MKSTSNFPFAFCVLPFTFFYSHPGNLSPIGDAVGNPDAAEAAAGEKQPGVALEAAGDAGEPGGVTDLVLGVRAVPAIAARRRSRAAGAAPASIARPVRDRRRRGPAGRARHR